MIDRRVVVFGSNGMLGSDVCKECTRAGFEVIPADRLTCDVRDHVTCNSFLESVRPQIAINCAAYTDVNGAETHRDEAFMVNGTGAGNVARAAQAVGAWCLFISTDYVFDGTAGIPYETDSPFHPINVYGESKLAGELETLTSCDRGAVLRTSWLYGENGKNFVQTMLALAAQGKPLRVIDDQQGSPTYTVDLARLIGRWCKNPMGGIFQGTNQGVCTWYGFAQEIFRLSGVNPISLAPVASSEFPTPARRPAYSVLSNRTLVEAGLGILPQWNDALRRYLDGIS